MILNDIDQQNFIHGKQKISWQNAIKDFYQALGAMQAQDIIHTLFTQPQTIPHINERYGFDSNEDTVYGMHIYIPIFHALFDTLSDEQRNHIVEQILNGQPEHNRGTFAKIFFSNPRMNETLSEAQKEQALQHNNGAITEALLANQHIVLKADVVQTGIFAPQKPGYGYDLNVAYATRHDANLNAQQLEQALNHPENDVVMAIASNPSMPFTSEQVSWGLTQDDFEMRIAFAENYGIHFTDEHINLGMRYPNDIPDDFFDGGYHDCCPTDVMQAFIANPQVNLSEKHIDKVLDREHMYLTELMLKKDNLILNEKQIEKILAIPPSYLYPGDVLENPNVHLNDKQLLKYMMQYPQAPEFLIKFYFSRENVVISELIIGALGVLDNEEANAFLAQRKENGKENEHNTNTNKGLKP